MMYSRLSINRFSLSLQPVLRRFVLRSDLNATLCEIGKCRIYVVGLDLVLAYVASEF